MSDTSFEMLPLKSVLNITRLATVLLYELSPTYRNTGERHDFWEMVYVDRGAIQCRANDDVLLLEQGELLFHAPNEFHSVVCDGKHGASLFIITFSCNSPCMKYFCQKRFRIDPACSGLMKRLIHECNLTFAVSEYPLRVLPDAPLGGVQMVRHYLEELLIGLLRSEQRMATPTTPDGRDLVQDTLANQICAYLKDHVCERITLEELARHFHFGKSRLSDIFKRSQNETIIGYHIKLKIEEAKRLLFEGKLPVCEIAAQLGFESPEYFSRTFRKHTGTSPSAFKASPIGGNATVYLDEELRLAGTREHPRD